MKIRILACGKVKQRFVLDGEAEYLKRIKIWSAVRIEELENSSKLPESEAKRKEAAAVIAKLEVGECFIALDERGKEFDSEQFAKFIERKMQSGCSQFAFGIGGAYGWDDAVRKRADLLLSLSKFTFPYQIVRLLLIEQLYRAMSIIKGQPYHKP